MYQSWYLLLWMRSDSDKCHYGSTQASFFFHLHVALMHLPLDEYNNNTMGALGILVPTCMMEAKRPYLIGIWD